MIVALVSGGGALVGLFVATLLIARPRKARRADLGLAAVMALDARLLLIPGHRLRRAHLLHLSVVPVSGLMLRHRHGLRAGEPGPCALATGGERR